MSLQVWLPLNGNLNNYGVSNTIVTAYSSPAVNDAGKIGKCYYFDGSDDYLNFGPQTINSSGEFSMTEWCYFSSAKTWCRPFEISNKDENGASGKTCIGIGMGSNGLTLNKFGYFNGAANPADISVQTVSLNTWYHIALTVSGTSVKVYVNGELKVTQTLTTSYAGVTFPYCYIGKSTWTSDAYLNGKINDFRFYDHCLSLEEIKEISQALVLHYPLRAPENQIVNSYSITGGSNSPGLTSEYLSDGSMKVVANGGSWRQCFFTDHSKSETNFQNNMIGGDKITISYDLLIESGTLGIPTLWINANNQYMGFSSEEPLTYGKWIRVYQNRTYVAVTDTSYGYFGMHLNFGGFTGTYYVRAFKAEHGTKSQTTWAPSIYDDSSNSIVYDCSGYNRNGTVVGNVTPYSGSPRNGYSTHIVSTNISDYSDFNNASFIRGSLASPMTPEAFTISWWANMENWSLANSGLLSLSNNQSWPNDYQESTLAQYDNVFRLNGTYPSNTSLSAVNLVINNAWHHYVLTYDKSTFKSYRDGALIESVSYSQTPSSFQYVYLGVNVAGGACRKTTGYWSDFRIYATALSADDVARLYRTSASIDKNKILHCYELVEE